MIRSHNVGILFVKRGLKRETLTFYKNEISLKGLCRFIYGP